MISSNAHTDTQSVWRNGKITRGERPEFGVLEHWKFGRSDRKKYRRWDTAKKFYSEGDSSSDE